MEQISAESTNRSHPQGQGLLVLSPGELEVGPRPMAACLSWVSLTPLSSSHLAEPRGGCVGTAGSCAPLPIHLLCWVFAFCLWLLWMCSQSCHRLLLGTWVRTISTRGMSGLDLNWEASGAGGDRLRLMEDAWAEPSLIPARSLRYPPRQAQGGSCQVLNPGDNLGTQGCEQAWLPV